MAELQALLNDGVIPVINAGSELQVAGEPQPPALLQAAVTGMEAKLLGGITLPEVPGAVAKQNSIFLDTDTALVCYKTAGGSILKFSLTL